MKAISFLKVCQTCAPGDNKVNLIVILRVGSGVMSGTKFWDYKTIKNSFLTIAKTLGVAPHGSEFLCHATLFFGMKSEMNNLYWIQLYNINYLQYIWLSFASHLFWVIIMDLVISISTGFWLNVKCIHDHGACISCTKNIPRTCSYHRLFSNL